MDSRRSPADIVTAQSPNEFAGFFGNAGPTRLSIPNLPGPVPTEPATVPFDNGGWFDDPERKPPSGPESEQTDPKTAIGWFQFRPSNLSLQHDDLVSQGENFGLKISTTPEINAKGPQKRQQHYDHSPRILCRQVQ